MSQQPPESKSRRYETVNIVFLSMSEKIHSDGGQYWAIEGKATRIGIARMAVSKRLNLHKNQRRFSYEVDATADQCGAKFGSCKRSSCSTQHILQITSPEKAVKAWSRRTTLWVPFNASNRLIRFATTWANIGWRRTTPKREKNGSSGFLLRRCRSWSMVKRWEPWTMSAGNDIHREAKANRQDPGLSQTDGSRLSVSHLRRHTAYHKSRDRGSIIHED